MGASRRVSLLRTALLVLMVGVVALVATHRLWLPGCARILIDDQGPAKADAAVVLAGDYTGIRVLRAAEMVKQGFVPAVLVSGPNHFYGFHESELAIAFAVKRGYPSAWFVPVPNEALSTRDEAEHFLPILEHRGVRRYLLVTSDLHTGRAARLFRAAARARGSSIEVRPVAAYHPARESAGWWRSREGRKAVFLETIKAVATVLGM